MYLRRLVVKNIRSLRTATMSFERGSEAGWHVILGSNAAGKSTLVRAFAIAVMGEQNVYASRHVFNHWIKDGQVQGSIEVQLIQDQEYDLPPPPSSSMRTRSIVLRVGLERVGLDCVLKIKGDGASKTIWGGQAGWFSASFGPFRRFTGGDLQFENLPESMSRLTPHLTALGEDVALTNAQKWLSKLYFDSLAEKDDPSPIDLDRRTLGAITSFINDGGFLPHDSKIFEVNGKTVHIRDGNRVITPLEQLSDGYRSALSMILELARQMFIHIGAEKMLNSMSVVPGTIQAPGVVFIDEVDAHLHPTWQRDIGKWLTKSFPNVQFIVTTHSPIVCRAAVTDEGAVRGSIWKLPPPGVDYEFDKVTELEFSQLVYGNVLDAYSTELFGEEVLRSAAGEQKIDRLAELNVLAVTQGLEADEETERAKLRTIFPAEASS